MQSKSTVEQISQDRQRSKVSTLAIGLRDVDYVQYQDISIPASAGGKSDYSKALGTWAKRDEQTGGTQFLNEALFSFIPFGNLSSEARSEMLQTMKQSKTYKITASDISYQSGRPVMTATIAIKPKGLIQVLRQYAEITGVGDVSQLDPSQYEKAGDVSMDIKIDILSRHLTQLKFGDQARVETYAGYGLNTRIVEPNKTVTIEELQSRLQ